MENVSAVTSFILQAYNELEGHRYLFFICFLLLYVVILLGNCVLILTIFFERGLHEPMYLFICNLAVNGLLGSTSLLPSMLVFVAIALSWIIPCLYFTIYFILSVQRSFCGRIIEQLYCSIYPLFKLSCSDTSVLHLVGLELFNVRHCLCVKLRDGIEH
ncbi:olfactory receptor 1S1-like [Conger conger]|uniref:olfactory receptor 1S1-like n=1 Tax=Conger conger TaxID=82655 RepID=UPI002A5A9995|nr:olfactory receptor 1S1-like [Conger conger]